jgi:hypothetical protein
MLASLAVFYIVRYWAYMNNEALLNMISPLFIMLVWLFQLFRSHHDAHEAYRDALHGELDRIPALATILDSLARLSYVAFSMAVLAIGLAYIAMAWTVSGAARR